MGTQKPSLELPSHPLSPLLLLPPSVHHSLLAFCKGTRVGGGRRAQGWEACEGTKVGGCKSTRSTSVQGV